MTRGCSARARTDVVSLWFTFNGPSKVSNKIKKKNQRLISKSSPGQRLALLQVRLLLMPSRHLAGAVSQNPVVRRSLECVTMVLNAMTAMRKPAAERPLTRSRLPPAALLAVGGWDRSVPNTHVQLYDARADRWMGVARGPSRGFHGCAVLNGAVYCIGGFDGERNLRSVRAMDVATRTWWDAGPMRKARSHLSVVALDGCIYAMGGCDGFGVLSTAERYRPDTGNWTLLAPMHRQRSDSCAAALRGKVTSQGGGGYRGCA